ncbi:unnamed protein product [Cylindrotheca closterium]|uniref:Orc1-like AAA ATPase domain-containing protein n=1 Tax=Cylindrotheca closterium TaxID=2856 RepID=A0AAD2PU43_9STRA|nr:unnamed protein product [Cylindrotheca closterium]
MCGVDSNNSASFSGQGSGSRSTTTFNKAADSRPGSFHSGGNDNTSIPTSSKTKNRHHDTSSNTTDSSQGSQEKKLDTKISQLGLYGRQKETGTIRKCLEDLVITGKNKLVYISGLSGTGKTALAATVADSVIKKNGIFAMGKFDQKLRDEPYAGIAAAGRHICGEILHRKNSSEHMDFEDVRKMIIKNVGSELSTLAMILPEIEDIVGSSDLLAQDNIAGGDYGSNKERLNNAIRTFFRTVATFFKPLVMVLDDIQWADLPSINLMQVLMTDESSSNFMLIALYRSNEVDETHVVTKMMKTLDEKEKEFDFDTTKIEVGDLKMEQVDEILVELLQLPSYRTADLSEIIHRRTGGNAFFVLNFIDMLKNQHLLVYSKVEKCWVWDETEIELETIATDNVVDILKQRMKNLPKQMREVLQLAACLGANEVLEQLNHPLMKSGRKLSIFKRFNVIKAYDRNLNPDMASTLPVMTDKNALSAMKILSSLLILTYVTNKAELPVVTSKMASLVNTFGVCDEAANAYCFRGTFATDLRVIDAHAKFAKGIMDRSKDRYSKAASKMYIFCLMSYTRDIRWVQKGYEENYHYSLQVGDIQMALYSFMIDLYYALVSGHSLEAIATEARHKLKSLARMNRGWQIGLMTILLQGVLNMQGQSEDPFVLKGEAMDETAMAPASPFSLDGAIRIGSKAIIYAFCGNHQANADQHMEHVQNAAIQLAGNGIGFWFEVYTAISSLHCARSASGRQFKKYQRFGQQTSKRVKKWIAQGCANLKQLDFLLDAELAVLAGNDKKARQCYKKSIRTAEKMLRVNDAGLASERYGEYLLLEHHHGNKEGARGALTHAVEFYSLWGSDLKVESIRSKHEELLRPSIV